MKLSLKAGTTSKLLDVFIQDTSVTTGAGLTGLVYNSASLTAYYYREGAASATAITLATMTLGTWATGGFVVIDGTNMPGCYQLGIPDAALAAGAKSVLVMLKGATNMAPLVLEIELTATDNQDSVRAGLTALPNAAAEAAGGLYTRGTGAGQIAQQANGQIDVNLSTVKTQAVTCAAGVTVLASVGTAATSTAQTGDSYARLGAPAGASVSADVAAVKTDTAAIKAKTDSLTFTVAGMADVNVVDWKGSAAPAMTGDAYARLGAPAGASIAADLVTIDADVLTRLAAASYSAPPSAASIAATVLTTQLTESYAANGIAPTLTQGLMAVHQMLMTFAIAGTSVTVKKLDGSTTAFVVTLDDATNPTAASRA